MNACAICGAPECAKETLEFPPDKRLCPGDFERCGRPELPMSDEVLWVLKLQHESARYRQLLGELIWHKRGRKRGGIWTE